MLLSRCCKEYVIIKEPPEDSAYYVCALCFCPTEPTSVIIFTEFNQFWDDLNEY